MSVITKHIENYENLVFSFENMHKRTSIIGVLPVQANTNFSKDENGIESYWFQLVCNYKSTYSRTDEHGEQHDDNASLKTLIIKFSMDHLKKYNVKSSDLKKFFDDNYVGKKFLFLPVSEEKQSWTNTKPRTPIKNQSECVVSSDFDLNEFMKIDKKVGTNKS
ncbi:hypothetical protein ACKGJI_04615 [Sulfurospirillum sp. 1307]